MSVHLEHPAEMTGRRFCEVSRRVVSDSLVETEYRAGYTAITVKSNFDGEQSLPDLLYNIISQKLERSAVS